MWNVSAPTVIGVRELNEFCEAIPRYSSSRGTRFKRRIGNLDDEEQQIKWAIAWLDALFFNREERRWGGTALTIERFGGCSRACLGRRWT